MEDDLVTHAARHDARSVLITAAAQLVRAASALDDPGSLPAGVLRGSCAALRQAQNALAAVAAVTDDLDLVEPAWFGCTDDLPRPAVPVRRLRIDDVSKDDE